MALKMNIFRFRQNNQFCLGLELSGHNYNLTAAVPDLSDISVWLAMPDPVKTVLDNADKACRFPVDNNVTRCAPLDTQEVWASGVTYFRSKVARVGESEKGGDFYDDIYEAERPEIFFKSTAARVRTSGEPVRIRSDSPWNVPEPELVLVLSSRGQIVGYTIGNDMSSRSIEGENPLYLPQAKVYDGSCALGPVITLKTGEEAPRKIEMTITRGGTAVFAGETSTSQMRRTDGELVDFLFRETTFPDGVFLLTGTGIVPPHDFTLRSGDMIRITIEGIGTLENFVA
jgi:2-dehydro-3-deoxy-D-arabinonate dehydratase